MREAITNPLGLVNVLDISHSVETLQGYAYPFHFQCDSDCSSSAQCAPGFCYNPTNHDGRCSPALPCITSADCSGLVDGQSHVCSANGFCTLPQRLDPCTGTCHP
jgi:hypothetical protein